MDEEGEAADGAPDSELFAEEEGGEGAPGGGGAVGWAAALVGPAGNMGKAVVAYDGCLATGAGLGHAAHGLSVVCCSGSSTLIHFQGQVDLEYARVSCRFSRASTDMRLSCGGLAAVLSITSTHTLTFCPAHLAAATDGRAGRAHQRWQRSRCTSKQQHRAKAQHTLYGVGCCHGGPIIKVGSLLTLRVYPTAPHRMASHCSCTPCTFAMIVTPALNGGGLWLLSQQQQRHHPHVPAARCGAGWLGAPHSTTRSALHS